MAEALQIVGALIILAAYWAMHTGRVNARSLSYLWLNIIGSLILAVLAVIEELWGFLLLEAAWTAIAAHGLLTRGKPAADQPSS